MKHPVVDLSPLIIQMLLKTFFFMNRIVTDILNFIGNHSTVKRRYAAEYMSSNVEPVIYAMPEKEEIVEKASNSSMSCFGHYVNHGCFDARDGSDIFSSTSFTVAKLHHRQSWSPQERCAVLRMPPRRASIRDLPLLKIREGGGGRHFEASCSYPTSEGHPLYLDGRTQVRVSLSASRRQGRHERAVREGPQHDARIPLFGCRLHRPPR